MDKVTVNYILRLIAQRVLGLLLFLLGALGDFSLREIIYFSVYIGTALISSLILYLVNPEILRVRGNIKTNSPQWDKILLLVFWVTAYFLIYLAAGLGHILTEPDVWFNIGILLYLLSAAISVWAQAVNKFLEPTARIQTDREQTVCRRGPYKLIRHPAYAAILIWCFAVCLVFPHLYVAEAALVAAAVICVRTCLEDKMLRKELPGYAEYAEDVQYRLIPYLW